MLSVFMLQINNKEYFFHYCQHTHNKCITDETLTDQ